MKRSSIAPPNDDELAAAEVIDLQKRRDRIDQIEQEQETTRLARAGDPEAMEALRASASVMASQPMGDEDDQTHDTQAAPTSPKTSAPRSSKNRPRTPKTSDRKHHQAQQRDDDHQQRREEESLEARAKTSEDRAFKLMDTAYQKWAREAKRNIGKANKDLAFDLGRDTVLYLRNGLIKSLGDMHDVINKLTTVKAGREEDPDAPAFDEEMESMRAALRGDVSDVD